ILSHAQAVNVNVSQLSPDQIQVLISQLQQLVALYEQLLALQMGNATSPTVTISPATSTISTPTSTTSIVVMNAPVTDTPNLNLGGQINTPTSTPAPVKVKTGWDQGAKTLGVNGLVALEAENPGASTTLFEVQARRGLYDSVTLTLNGTDYSLPITNI